MLETGRSAPRRRRCASAFRGDCMIRKRTIVTLILMVLYLALPHIAVAAGSAGSVRGRLLGPDGVPKKGIEVHLHNAVTGFIAKTTTSDDGKFEFFNVPYNPYVVEARVKGLQPGYQEGGGRS